MKTENLEELTADLQVGPLTFGPWGEHEADPVLLRYTDPKTGQQETLTLSDLRAIKHLILMNTLVR